MEGLIKHLYKSVVFLSLLMFLSQCELAREPIKPGQDDETASLKIRTTARMGSSDYNFLINKGSNDYASINYAIGSPGGGTNHYGHLSYPANLRSYPMVLIFHAHGRTYDDYTIIQDHLASHGIGSASIEYQVNEQPGETIAKHLHYLKGNYNFTDDVAVLGHSMGGAVAYLHAQDVKNYLSKPIKALILAAPHYKYRIERPGSDYTGNAHQNSKSLINITKGLLVLYGSRDSDGATGGMNPRETPYFFYDKVGTEYNGLTSYPEKDFVFMYEVWHNTAGTTENPRAYVTAYLLKQLYGRSQYADYFKGQKNLLPTKKVDIQHGESSKRVLANFENNNKNRNTLGGDITYHNGLGNSSSLHDRRTDQQIPNNYTPHYQRFLGVTWSGSSKVRFHFPGNNDNMSNYNYLSFRVSQNFHSNNEVGRDQDFYVRLRDNDGEYKSLRLSKYGQLPYPLDIYKNNANDQGRVRLNGMKTFIIPLDDFTGVDLGDLDYLSIRFTHDDYEEGSVNLDNIEFIR